MDLKHLLGQTSIKNDTEASEALEAEPEPEPMTDGGDETTSELISSVDARFQIPWVKLEKGAKMNRLLVFVESEKEEHSLSGAIAKDLKNLLFKGCENGLFNKQSEVKYNEETCLIESLKSLEINESSKKYKLKTTGTKNRSVSKSRSNIDRLMKKK